MSAPFITNDELISTFDAIHQAAAGKKDLYYKDREIVAVTKDPYIAANKQKHGYIRARSFREIVLAIAQIIQTTPIRNLDEWQLTAEQVHENLARVKTLFPNEEMTDSLEVTLALEEKRNFPATTPEPNVYFEQHWADHLDKKGYDVEAIRKTIAPDASPTDVDERIWEQIPIPEHLQHFSVYWIPKLENEYHLLKRDIQWIQDLLLKFPDTKVMRSIDRIVKSRAEEFLAARNQRTWLFGLKTAIAKEYEIGDEEMRRWPWNALNSTRDPADFETKIRGEAWTSKLKIFSQFLQQTANDLCKSLGIPEFKTTLPESCCDLIATPHFMQNKAARKLLRNAIESYLRERIIDLIGKDPAHKIALTKKLTRARIPHWPAAINPPKEALEEKTTEPRKTVKAAISEAIIRAGESIVRARPAQPAASLVEAYQQEAAKPSRSKKVKAAIGAALVSVGNSIANIGAQHALDEELMEELPRL